MKATFEAHRQGGLWQDHCDKSSTVTTVTVVQEEHEMPEMLNGRGFERCDILSPENCVTVPGINEPKVGLCGEPTLSQDGHQDITAEEKDHSVTEYPDLSKDANLPLRRLKRQNCWDISALLC
ncbi:MAG: hypothetical protein LRZ88_06765 [Candidatus Cloacimonetes bacterium]|nr:hypothetical protein [Candidatus Cloacimonadota bacterium]